MESYMESRTQQDFDGLVLLESPFCSAVCDAEGNWLKQSRLWRESIIQPNLAGFLNTIVLLSEGSAKSLVDDVLQNSAVVSVEVRSTENAEDVRVLMLWQEPWGENDITLNVVLMDKDASCLNDELDLLRQRYELILSAAGEGIYGLDLNGCTTFANQAAVDILGWHPDDILGTPLHDIHHHSYPDGSPYPRECCPIYAAFKDGDVHRVDDEVFWRADGSSIPVEYVSTPIVHNGEIKGAVVIFKDISERKKLESEKDLQLQEIKKLKEELELERDYLRDEIHAGASFGNIVGQSPALNRTLAQIEAVAATPSSVLILGESGVGKEMIARAIHTQSPRKDEPLVKVNCASIPKDLFESEFFGHVRGAFTGAHKDRVGRMQLANGGTLFLDEVGEIPLDLQGKLLRALQEQEFERVGDDATHAVDVRIVAATNRDLEKEVAAGRFREDLYYRLSVFPISVPPLRERPQDIPLLAQHFLEEQCQQLGREAMQISKAQAQALSALNWPGNIRELKNVIERAIILSRGSRLRLDLAMPDLVQNVEEVFHEVSAPEAEVLDEEAFRALERANIIKALEKCDWKVSGAKGAAALLGIKPSTLSYRMNNFSIERPR